MVTWSTASAASLLLVAISLAAFQAPVSAPLSKGDLVVANSVDSYGDNTITVTSGGNFSLQLSDGSKYGAGPSHAALDGFWDLKNDPERRYDLAGSDAGLLSKDFGYPGQFEAKPGSGAIKVLEQNRVRVVLEYTWPVRGYGNNSYKIDPKLVGREIWTIYRPGKIYERFSFSNTTPAVIKLDYLQYNFNTTWTKFDGEGPYYDSEYWQRVGGYVPKVGSPWGFVNEHVDNSPDQTNWMLHSTAGGFSENLPPGRKISPGVVTKLGSGITVPVKANFLQVLFEDTGSDAYRGQLFAGMRSKIQVGGTVPPGNDSFVRHLVLFAGDNGIADRVAAAQFATEYRQPPTLSFTAGSGGRFDVDSGCYELTGENHVDFVISGVLHDPAFEIVGWRLGVPEGIHLSGELSRLDSGYVAVVEHGRLLVQIMQTLAPGTRVRIP